MAVIDLKKTTIRVVGNTGTTDHLDIKVGSGTLSWDETRNIEYIKDRGLLDSVREGDEEPVDVKFDLMYEYLSAASGDSVPTIEELLKFEGDASSWLGTGTDPCQPKCVDIIVFRPACDSVNGETITLAEFRYEKLGHDAKAGTITCSGKCNVTKATASRGAATSI